MSTSEPGAVEIQQRSVMGKRPGPRLLITGGVHGDEFEPMAALRRLADLVETMDVRGELVVAPVANEAAYLHGARCAEDGLDLARVCPGRPDGSITERTAFALSAIIRRADYYIDLHTGGNVMDVMPLAGYKLVDDLSIRDQQRDMARAFNLDLLWGTDAKLEGRTLSVARDAGVPTIYAEYLGSGRCDPDGVQAYVDGCLNVMRLLGMVDREQPPSRIRFEVEDHRDGAGHMQVRNLAPMTGFFDPSVRLGDMLEKGSPIGTISDPLGEKTQTVFAQETGLVVVLRTFSRVFQGESLGVVLELDS